MLRIAVPNKGALSDAAREIFTEAGYRQRRDSRELVMRDPENQVEFFYLRPRDIAVYVGSGTLDLGLTGRDLFQDAQVGDTAEEIMALGFGRSTFRFAAPAGRYSSLADLEGKRIATSYDGLLEDYLSTQSVTPGADRAPGRRRGVLRLPRSGRRHRRCGGDRKHPEGRRNGDLRRSDHDLRAILIAPSGAPKEARSVLLRRLQGVLVARRYVMIDYDVRRDLLEDAAAVTPGLESPTISPLQDEEWVAVRSMVQKDQMNKVMDDLYALGARAILASAIHAIRL